MEKQDREEALEKEKAMEVVEEAREKEYRDPSFGGAAIYGKI